MQPHVSGTEGYAAEADTLFVRYESIPPEQVHAAVLHLLPKAPARVLDIGAGTGRDAAWFASLGHQVVAVEPTAALRLRAMQIHASAAITWIDDSLPELAALAMRDEAFDLVMITAVLMHLDEAQRQRALPNIAAGVAPGGKLIMTLRHGPVPPGRRMFEIDPETIIAPARQLGLRLELNRHGPSSRVDNQAAGVSWTTLAFAKQP
ncbi:class I SAM-dependent methyltransferase [Bradyrhizobium sp. 83002]|uniref:class I SAM-dependent methyltransferase n=1 Tax=Bradyrhizobium aeschynomenes TaxID=2734909 RepID=UPI001557C066|nr:class I SAM-dependent methyltransferase [Bradyrhizobium aeschynomenes]NPU12597.1 class I SAM-dependent methyltransferase [Bradyrhizobium aeschynomenes]